MSMREWAIKEIELLKEVNKPDEDEEFDYVGSCCDSALKAFETLLDDEHSGMSIAITKAILNRLIDNKPLTAINDVPEAWNFIGYFNKEQEKQDIKNYQCKRMGSLFKEVHPDGTTIYSSTDRAIGINVNNPDLTFGGGAINQMIDEMFPITMPYYPEDKPYKIYTEDFLCDADNGDYDTEGYFYIITPGGERIELNLFYHYPKNGDRIKLTKEQYEEMKTKRIDVSKE